jgi:hypothetical protein
MAQAFAVARLTLGPYGNYPSTTLRVVPLPTAARQGGTVRREQRAGLTPVPPHRRWGGEPPKVVEG